MSRLEGLTEKELRRLGRRDLLALLLEQEREMEALEQALSAEKARAARETEEQERAFRARLERLSRQEEAQRRLWEFRLENEKARPDPARVLARGSAWAAAALAAARLLLPAGGKGKGVRRR